MRGELQAVGFGVASSPCQTVGTPPNTVTRSASNSSYSDLPSRSGPGNDELGADHRRGVRQAPGVDVEHRHHRQHTSSVLDRFSASGATSRIRVQQRRTVAVQHAFRIAGRARRVAQRRGQPLVELRPVEAIGVRIDQVFVAAAVRPCSAPACGRGRSSRRIAAPSRQCGAIASMIGRNVRSKNSNRVFGVIDDPGDLLGMQARVDRVQHAPRCPTRRSTAPCAGSRSRPAWRRDRTA